MKSYFVDFDGWVKVPAESAEEAENFFYEHIKWRLEKAIRDYDINFSAIEAEEE